MSDVIGDWHETRVLELRGWNASKLLQRAKHLGIERFNPKQPRSLVDDIATEELRLIRGEAAAVPGAVLEETEEYNDAEARNNYPPADVAGNPFVQEYEFKEYDHPNNRYVNAEFKEDERPLADGSLSWPYDIRTASGQFIYEVILPEVLRHFFAKNAEYGDRHRQSKYGVKGELIGLDRKIGKVHEAVWNGKAMQFEQPQEMIWDIIGSCFLMLDLMAQGTE